MIFAQQMPTAEADAIAGAKSKCQAERQARRHGHQGGRRQAWLEGLGGGLSGSPPPSGVMSLRCCKRGWATSDASGLRCLVSC